MHCSGHALELHVAHIHERDPIFFRGIGDRLGDEHLVDQRKVGDPRGEVHGLAEVVPLLIEDWSRVQADVGMRQPGRRQTFHHL